MARHCPELTGDEADPAQLADEFAKWGERLCHVFPEHLSALLGSEKLSVTMAGAEWVDARTLRNAFGPGVARFLFTMGDGHLLLSLDLESAFSLTDRVFGGAGKAPAARPERLPAAADLSLGRFVRAVGSAIEACLGGDGAPELAGGGDFAGKFLRGKELGEALLAPCEIRCGEAQVWRMNLALSRPALASLHGNGAKPVRKGVGKRADSLMPDLPLTLRAVLANVTIPLAKLSALRPGDVLPLPLPRDVPLLAGETEIARGKAGSSDGRFAVNLDRVNWIERINGRD